MTREEFWESDSANIIMDLLIDITNRENFMEALKTIDPDYEEYLPQAKEEFNDLYIHGGDV